MFGPEKKLLDTKLAKQATGYWLIQGDLEFSRRAFHEASKLPTLKELPASKAISHSELEEMARTAVESAAKEKTAFIRTFKEQEGPTVIRNALFEAGIVSYGRCFNSGARTTLGESTFRGSLSNRRQLHSLMIRVRNKHVGHSELKLERSLVGIQMVTDPRFGPRPSVAMSIFAVRRDAPSPERLLEMAAHCEAIIVDFLQPRLKKLGNEIREQLLRMPSEQIDVLPEYDRAMQSITAGLTFEDI
jgi:hypothetical protein